MSDSLGDQIAKAFNRPKASSSESNAVGGIPSDDASPSASKYLDALHSCIRDCVVAKSVDVTDILELAKRVGEFGLRVRPRDDESQLIYRTLDELFEGNKKNADLAEVYRAASALAFDDVARAKYREFLLDQAIKGAFDPHGDSGISPSWERYKFVRLGGKAAFFDELKVRREHEEKNLLRTEATVEGKKRSTLSRLQKDYRRFIAGRSNVHFSSEPLDEVDLALILAWSGSSSSASRIGHEAVSKLLRDEEVTRLYSARQAERACLEYLYELHGSAEDVSIEQLGHGARNWVAYDIESGKHLYDVKNARRSFSSPQSYSEYCVPLFKRERSSNREVKILGTLSDYQTADKCRRDFEGKITVLGEVSADELSELDRWIDAEYGELLSVPSLRESAFLPGWIFEYSRRHYPRVSGATGNELLASTNEADSYIRDRCSSLFVLAAMYGADPQSFPEVQANFYFRKLIRLNERIGISRRSLFMLILGETLKAASSRDTTYRPKEWRSWIFADQTVDRYSKTSPLCLQDTEEFISNLINTLEDIWHFARDRLFGFRRFRLSHPQILQGEGGAGSWTTIFAYCGGWLSEPVKAKCGKNPIYLGQSESCSNCGRLICPDCKFCGRSCAQCAIRQKRSER